MDTAEKVFRAECGTILDHFGIMTELDKASEELIELADAFDELRTWVQINPSIDRNCQHNVAQEIADVEIMLEQMKQGLDIRELVAEQVVLKLARTKTRIAEGYYETSTFGKTVGLIRQRFSLFFPLSKAKVEKTQPGLERGYEKKQSC